MSESVVSQATGSPDAFRAMAHEVNRISGTAQHTTADLVHRGWEKGQPARQPQLSFRQTAHSNLEVILAPFTQLPRKLGQVIRENPLPVAACLVVLGLTPLLAMVLALLDTINSVPLLAPCLQLVGLSYTSWLIYRAVYARRQTSPSEG